MGLNYSYNLICFTRDLERVFSVISNHCVPVKKAMRLVFPDGTILTPQFASGSAERVNPEVMIATSARLFVSIDVPIERYLIDNYGLPEYWPSNAASAGQFLAYVTIYLHIGDQLTSIVFQAPTNSMSLLFEETSAFREAVLNIAQKAAALLLIFDRQQPESGVVWRNDPLPGIESADYPDWTPCDTAILDQLLCHS